MILAITRFTVDEYAARHGLTVAAASKVLRRAALDGRLRVKEANDFKRTYHGRVVTFEALATEQAAMRSRAKAGGPKAPRRYSKGGPTSADIGKANRALVVAAMQAGLTSTTAIAKAVGLSRSTVCTHLREMRKATAPEKPAPASPWSGLDTWKRKRA